MAAYIPLITSSVGTDWPNLNETLSSKAMETTHSCSLSFKQHLNLTVLSFLNQTSLIVVHTPDQL